MFPNFCVLQADQNNSVCGKFEITICMKTGTYGMKRIIPDYLLTIQKFKKKSTCIKYFYYYYTFKCMFPNFCGVGTIKLCLHFHTLSFLVLTVIF